MTLACGRRVCGFCEHSGMSRVLQHTLYTLYNIGPSCREDYLLAIPFYTCVQGIMQVLQRQVQNPQWLRIQLTA